VATQVVLKLEFEAGTSSTETGGSGKVRRIRQIWRAYRAAVWPVPALKDSQSKCGVTSFNSKGNEIGREAC